MAPAPELVPVAEVTLTRLLVPFLWVCCCIVGLAVAHGANVFSRAFFGTVEGKVGWIPYLGKILALPIERVAQKISSYIGGWEHYFDRRVAEQFHTLAQLVQDVGIAVYETDLKVWHLANALNALLVRLIQTKVLQEHAARQAKTQTATTHLTHRVAGIEHRLNYAPRTATRTSVRTLEGEITHVIEWDIPRLRARTRSIEKSLDRLWHKVKGLDKVIATTAFVGAVAVALGKLGAGWVRCPAATDLFRRRGCNAWSEIEGLLVAAAALELPFTLELLAEVGREVIKDGTALMDEFR